MNQRLCLLSCAGIFVGACGVSHLDAGTNGDDGSDGGNARGVLWPDPPSNSLGLSCPLPPADFAPDFAGAWKGTFDSDSLPTGPNIEIDIDGAVQASPGFYRLCGKIILGSGDPLPLPTDPEAPPPNAPPPFTLQLEAVGGFPYEFQTPALIPVAIESLGLQLSIDLTQVFKAWCNMQPSFQLDPSPDVQAIIDDPTRGIFDPTPSRFVCIPPHTISSSASDGVECEGLGGVYVHGRSCPQALYCISRLCTCGSVYQLDDIAHGNEGCTAGNGSSSAWPYTVMRFDLTVTGSAMTGNLVLPDRVESLHLTR